MGFEKHANVPMENAGISERIIECADVNSWTRGYGGGGAQVEVTTCARALTGKLAGPVWRPEWWEHGERGGKCFKREEKYHTGP